MLLVGVLAGVLFGTGVVGAGGDDQSDELARLQKPLDQLMSMRDDFFAVERDYLAAYGLARRHLQNYETQSEEVAAEYEQIEQEYSDEFDACYEYVEVPCPDPEYPDYPDVPVTTRQTEQIRETAGRLQELSTQLLATNDPAELKALHTRLASAIDTLLEEAQHNADVLDEAVEPEEDGEGYLDEGKLRTLRVDTALPILRSMNLAAVNIIRDLDLPRKEYDVPGGSDIDDQDHSNLI